MAAITVFCEILMFRVDSGILPAMFFVSSSDALFSFYICSHSKAEKVKFSEWLPALTNGVCVRDVISHSLAKVFLLD